MLGTAIHFAERLHPFHDEARFRQDAEIVRQPGLDFRQEIFRVFDVACPSLVGVRVIELLVCPDKFKELSEAAFKPHLLANGLHFGLDPVNLGEAKCMDLVCGHGNRGVPVKLAVVIVLTVRQCIHATRLCIRVGTIRLQPVNKR